MKCYLCQEPAELEDESTVATDSGIAILRKWRCTTGQSFHWWNDVEHIDVIV